ncbi:hypothetical protein JCM11641_000107 [Rhodosporidiobolus odoratus]
MFGSFSPLWISFVALLLQISTVQAQATINSPASVTECLPQQLTVNGGEGPYTVQVLPGGSAGGTPLETFPTLDQAGSVRWVADLPAGQNITFSVRDNSGVLAFSAPVPILPGTSTDCLGQNASGGSATTDAASSTSSGAASASSLSGSSGSASGPTSASGWGSASAAPSDTNDGTRLKNLASLAACALALVASAS